MTRRLPRPSVNDAAFTFTCSAIGSRLACGSRWSTRRSAVLIGCTDAKVLIGDSLHRVALDRELLTRLASGAFVQQPSVGANEVDLIAASELGVVVSNAAGYNRDAVAEWVVASVYCIVRGLNWRHTLIRDDRPPTGTSPSPAARPRHQPRAWHGSTSA
jgi:phosphoglycerate dehydrogenase-like enzyme